MRKTTLLLLLTAAVLLMFSGCYFYTNVTDRDSENYQGWTVYSDPALLDLISPADGVDVIIFRDSCELVCSDILNTSGYTFQVATDPDFTAVVLDSGTVSEHTWTFTPSSLANDTTYYWRARAGDGDYTVAPFTFIIDEPEIGDILEGGIVFYTDGTGGGLVAAPEDQTGVFGVVWGPDQEIGYYGYNGYTAPQLTGIGDGAENTQAIVNYLGEYEGIPYAAKICSDLELNGYDDWFLPSYEELSMMRGNLLFSAVGGFIEGVEYWSSTESSESDAYYLTFSFIGEDNYWNSHLKSRKHKVRAVRAFSY